VVGIGKKPNGVRDYTRVSIHKGHSLQSFLKLAAMVAMVGLVPACATITRGTTQAFVVESSPPGASVKATNGFTCPATPCKFNMPRKDSFTVTVSKDGYETQTAEVLSNMSGGGTAGMLGNVLVGGFIGIGVDATSGALNDLAPNPLVMILKPLSASAPTTSVADPIAPNSKPSS
jgi:hypothetical protein